MIQWKCGLLCHHCSFFFFIFMCVCMFTCTYMWKNVLFFVCASTHAFKFTHAFICRGQKALSLIPLHITFWDKLGWIPANLEDSSGSTLSSVVPGTTHCSWIHVGDGDANSEIYDWRAKIYSLTISQISPPGFYKKKNSYTASKKTSLFICLKYIAIDRWVNLFLVICSLLYLFYIIFQIENVLIFFMCLRI